MDAECNINKQVIDQINRIQSQNIQAGCRSISDDIDEMQAQIHSIATSMEQFSEITTSAFESVNRMLDYLKWNYVPKAAATVIRAPKFICWIAKHIFRIRVTSWRAAE